MAQMELFYWPVKARGYAAMAVAQAGGLNIKVTVPEMEVLKPELPFGQVPYLVDGNVRVAQSNAILRYVARKGGLEGDSDQACAVSNMLIEEANDIFNMLVRAHYSPEKAKGYAELLAEDGPLYKQLAYLEAMHPGDGPYFNNQVEKRLAGAYSIACTLDMLINLEPSILGKYPKLELFYTTMISSKAFDGIRDFGNHFQK